MAISEEQWAELAGDRGKSVDDIRRVISEINDGWTPPEVVLYCDRHGDPLTLGEWAILCSTPRYREIASTVLPSGVWIITIWHGLNSFPETEAKVDGVPLPVARADANLFETEVLPSKPRRPGVERLGGQRYDTEQAALYGHADMVAAWAGLQRRSDKPCDFADLDVLGAEATATYCYAHQSFDCWER